MNESAVVSLKAVTSDSLSSEDVGDPDIVAEDKEDPARSGNRDAKKRRVYSKTGGIISVNSGVSKLPVRPLGSVVAPALAPTAPTASLSATPSGELSVSYKKLSAPEECTAPSNEIAPVIENISEESTSVSEDPPSQHKSNMMLSLRIIDIPAYLHNSVFYKSLQDGEAEETILVPSDCIKPDETVSTNEDLRSLLMTLRYWVGNCICDSILLYVASQPAVATDATLAEFYPDFPVLKHFKQLAQSTAPIRLAIDTGEMELVNYYLARGFSWPKDACNLIAKVGNIDMLKAALAAQCTVSRNATDIAATHGHLQCLRLLAENGGFCTKTTMAAAVEGNHLSCLQYAHQQLLQNSRKCTLDSKLYDFALSNHNLEMVQYLHKNCCAWNLETSRAAAKYGQVSSFAYMHENGSSCWDKSVCELAVKHGHVETVLYLLHLGCLPSDNAWEYVGDVFHQILHSFLESKLPWSAAPDAMLSVITSGNLEGLMCLIENGCPWYPDTTMYMAKTDNLAMLQYAHENGCPWSEHTFMWVASLECMTYAHTHGMPILPNTCAQMLRTRHERKEPISYACFRYAHQHGSQLHSVFTTTVASLGNLELLQYLYEQGVSWHPLVASEAMQYKRLDCLEFALTHEAPYSASNLIQLAKVGKDEACIKMAAKYEHGCSLLTEVNRSAWNHRRVYYLLLNGPTPTNTLYDMNTDELRQVLQQAVEGGQLWTATPDAMRHVIETGSLEFLKCLTENGCPWHSQATVYIVKAGNLPMLQYFHEEGCPWDPKTTSYIARNNNLAMLQFVHENGCPWSEDTCMRTSSLKCMTYAHTHGAPIPPNACELLLYFCAQPQVSFECFKYAHQHGGVLLSRFVSYAESHHHADLLEYLREHESEWAVPPAAEEVGPDGVATLQQSDTKRRVIKIKRRVV